MALALCRDAGVRGILADNARCLMQAAVTIARFLHIRKKPTIFYHGIIQLWAVPCQPLNYMASREWYVTMFQSTLNILSPTMFPAAQFSGLITPYTGLNLNWSENRLTFMFRMVGLEHQEQNWSKSSSLKKKIHNFVFFTTLRVIQYRRPNDLITLKFAHQGLPKL